MKDEKFIKKWEKVRQKGRKRYMLTASVSMGIAVLIGVIIGSIYKGDSIYGFWEYNVYIYLGKSFGGFLGGLIGSFARWQLNEEKYSKLIYIDSEK